MLMHMEIVKLNNKDAKKMLEGQTNPREFRRTHAENLKAAWARGEYVMSHQGIAYVGKKLIDGFHRLTALSEMPDGFFIEVAVCRDVHPDAVKVTDIGFKRTAADILGANRKITEVARFLATIYLSRANAATPTYLIPFVARLTEPHDDLMEFCSTACKMWSSAPMRAAVCVISLADGDVDHAKLVYRAMVTQDFATMPRSAQAVFRAHLNGTVRASQPTDAFIRALRIFNPDKANQAKVQVRDSAPALELVRGVLARAVFGIQKAGRTAPAPAVSTKRAAPYALAAI